MAAKPLTTGGLPAVAGIGHAFVGGEADTFVDRMVDRAAPVIGGIDRSDGAEGEQLRAAFQRQGWI